MRSGAARGKEPVVPRPFEQIPFAELPAAPVRPHRFFALPERRVAVRCEPFGEVTVSWREAGAGEPLLLVHGLMTTGYSYRYLIDHLPGRRLVVPDLVGCGRSDKPACRYAPRDVARFIGAFARAVGVRGCPIVGNSMGGYLAMWLALDDPEATARIVNVHSPGLPIARMWALAAAMALPSAERLLAAIVGRDPRRWAHARTHYWDESLKSLEEAAEYGDPLAAPDGARSFARYLSDALGVRGMRAFAAELGRRPFPVPLQLLFARRDVMVPPVLGARLHALVPAAELVWLDGCSHFAHVDRPDLVAREILRFLA